MDSPSSVRLKSTFFYCILLLLMSNLIILSTLKNCQFPAIFNFGDSNSDTGGLSAAYFPPSPYGETYFHMPIGRPSDGRLIINFITERLGLPYLHAYLDSVGAYFTNGANFATSASTIRPEDRGLTEGGFSPFYLEIQYLQFQQFKSRSQLVRQHEEIFKLLLPKKEYFSQALYTFDIGQNDLGAGFFGNKSIQEVSAFVPDIVNRFSMTVKSIYSLEARSFWIHNTGPIGCLPYLLAAKPESEKYNAGCATAYNKVAQEFNQRLKDAVVQLRKDLPLAAAITYIDVYSAKYSLLSQANKYGFELPVVACCGYGGKYNFSSSVSRGGMISVSVSCGGTISVNGREIFVGSCERPSVRVNWDGIHYTEAVNKWVFNRIVHGAFSDPPIPLRMACRSHSP